MITCPDCHGEGTLIGMFPVYAEDVPEKDRKPFIEFPCPRCKGAKEVPEVHFEWIERGKALRQRRRDEKITLREFCQANNVSPVDRCSMESGLVDPDTFVPRTWDFESSPHDEA